MAMSISVSGIGLPFGGNAAAASAIPVPVTTKNLLIAWNTQTTAGNTSTPVKVPGSGQGNADLVAAGWALDLANKQLFCNTGTTHSLSGIDFSNYEVFIRNALTDVTFTNCKVAWGTSTGNRIIDFGDAGTAGWKARFVNCLIDLQGQTSAVNGALATNGGIAGDSWFTDCRWVNAKHAYIEWAYGTATVLRNYFGPVATYGTLDDGSHCEHWHASGGTTNITDSFFDQRWAGTIYNPRTAFVFAEGGSSDDTINMITSITYGVADEIGHPTTWGLQADEVGGHAFDGFVNATDCCLQKGSIGYCSVSAHFTPTRCLNIDTGATIIDGTNP